MYNYGLRWVTHKQNNYNQNNYNQSHHSNTSSKYRGVGWDKKLQK